MFCYTDGISFAADCAHDVPLQERRWALDAEEAPVLHGEFWTARQRQANSIHEIPYRACFKPQLPAFFIKELSAPGDVVFDPFMGRGTTIVEAALLGRDVAGCDVNELAHHFTVPRLNPPTVQAIQDRLEELELGRDVEMRKDLLVFYHPDTLREITNLRRYLCAPGQKDAVDGWLRLLALTRLTGHSSGFLSAFTLPPNQAVSVAAQARINRRRNQAPPRRELRPLLIRKARSLLRSVNGEQRLALIHAGRSARLLTQDSRRIPQIDRDTVQLTVTSPPFLDVVDYAGDNWLRRWFADLPTELPGLLAARTPAEWAASMREVFTEVFRITRPGGFLACEVGEVRRGQVALEDHLIPACSKAGWKPVVILHHNQKFTKTAHCWGVRNNEAGTNSQRIAVFQKP